jgi:tetratricopeptide (TPR) repeat protein
LTENGIMKMNKIFMIITIVSTISISWAKNLKISTFPDEAEIYIKQKNSTEHIKIGVSPLQIPFNNIIANKDEIIFLIIKKNNHQDYNLVITSIKNAEIELNLTLEPVKIIDNLDNLDLMIAELFEAQRLTRVKNYVQALKVLESNEKKFPYLSIIHELKGSNYYLMKDYKSALAAYRKSFSINPQNIDAFRMKNYLEANFNLK